MTTPHFFLDLQPYFVVALRFFAQRFFIRSESRLRPSAVKPPPAWLVARVGVGRTALDCTVLRNAAYLRFMPSEILLRAPALMVRFCVVGTVSTPAPSSRS